MHARAESLGEAVNRKVHGVPKRKDESGKTKRPENEAEGRCQSRVSHCREKKANDTIENT